MYKPFEIFARMPESIALRLFQELSVKNPLLIASTLDTLAKQRNLRPVFIEKKSDADKAKWMREMLGKVVNNSSAAYTMQLWLVSCHTDMLKAFLTSLGIAHDENGTIEDLPEAPDLEKLKPAVDSLVGAFDPELVKVYLHAFQSFDPKGWPSLASLLTQDERLKM